MNYYEFDFLYELQYPKNSNCINILQKTQSAEETLCEWNLLRN